MGLKGNNVEGSFFLCMLFLVGKCLESIDDVGLVECVKVWCCGIVIL